MQILKSTKVIFVLIGFLFTCNFLQAENDQKMKAVHELFEAMDTKNNIDKTVVTKAIHKLVTAESISCCLFNSSEYHFNENPLGGKPI